MADHEKKNISVDEIWFARQRWVRTAVQTALAFLVGLGGSVALLQVTAPQVIDAIKDVLPPAAVGWVASAFVVVIGIASALAKIMAIPVVNEWLTRIGLGSVPKEAAQRQAVAERVGEVSPPQIVDGSDQAS
jgi:cyanate permease